MESLTTEAIAAIRSAGAVAAAAAGVGELSRARATIEARRDVGLHDTMSFTFRNPARSTKPSSALPSARSAIVAAYPYRRGAPAVGPSATLSAEVASYASQDAYVGLRSALEAGAEILRGAGHRAVVVADDNALVDRAMAVRAGLGWTGKNTNVLVPGVGSWVVLGTVLTDAALTGAASDGASTDWASSDWAPEDQRGCGSCTRCLSGCPTGALVAPGVLDSGRCLSWLLQRTGSFPRRYRIALGTRIYGCDECQIVCPPSMVRPSDEGADPPGGATSVSIEDLLGDDDSTILERFGGWYIPRRDPRYIRRNALVVLGNALAEWSNRGSPSGSEAGVDVDSQVSTRAVGENLLERYLSDEDPLLVEHAAWAARRGGFDTMLTGAAFGEHPEVVAELARTHPNIESSLATTPVGRETPVDGPRRR